MFSDLERDRERCDDPPDRNSTICSHICGRGTPWWCGRLDRLGRSCHISSRRSRALKPRCGVPSVTESSTPLLLRRQLIFSIFGALAEFERNLIRERTSAGLVAARARGRVGGRPPEDDTEKDQAGKTDA
ncbi:recombinase family protein [Rhodococcus hoagii]|nr:recombinase family protein [Prescottella equi]